MSKAGGHEVFFCLLNLWPQSYVIFTFFTSMPPRASYFCSFCKHYSQAEEALTRILKKFKAVQLRLKICNLYLISAV